MPSNSSAAGICERRRKRHVCVGAGARDTGFSLTRLTFQITHATDSDTNAERDYIIAELNKNRVIRDAESYQSGQHLSTDRVNHYVTDGQGDEARLTRFFGLTANRLPPAAPREMIPLDR